MSVRRKVPPREARKREPECFCMGIGPEITRMLGSLGVEDARDHFRSARVEALKGLRALIDRRIEALSKGRGRGTKIEVE